VHDVRRYADMAVAVDKFLEIANVAHASPSVTVPPNVYPVTRTTYEPRFDVPSNELTMNPFVVPSFWLSVTVH